MPDPMRAEAPGTRLWLAALALALWPVLAVHAGLAVSMQKAYVPACNPYWDGCTSISRAGRHGLANPIYQGLLLPYAALLAVYWHLAQGWLRSLNDLGSRAMQVAGTLGAVFLALYLTFLGSEGEIYQLLRRYGIYVYFGGTYIAQVLLTGRLRQAATAEQRPSLAAPARIQLGLCLLVLLIGLLTVAAYALPVDRDRLQNVSEWWSALLLQGHVLAIALCWRRTGFVIDLRT
ncbi:MAG: hypothetical protein R3202_05760, partial [Candidatus Competibacterales bacterium]|nr:hypothetical protein [Candidatus Competibacterales bacterium]